MHHKRKTLLASNVAYFPSVGGSEMVLQRILEGVRDQFDDVSVMVPLSEQTDYEVNGIHVLKYSRKRLWPLIMRRKPTVYFPNMVHSPLTYQNLAFISRFASATVVNMVGGYSADTSLYFRRRMLKNVAKYSNTAIHVDEMSAEYLIDRAINNHINFEFITQGLDFAELHQFLDLSPRPYFVFAHNLWHWKGVDTFLDRVAAALPQLRFIIIASDKQGDYINTAREKSKSLSNVEMHLGLSRSEFLQVLAGSSGVISTSRIEGAQPNILLECGYLGIPYLSLPPGQNYGHYPHVEMYYSAEQIVARLQNTEYGLREIKREALLRAKTQFSGPEYSWEAVIGKYRDLFSRFL